MTDEHNLKQQTVLKLKQWVRLRSGQYKGDIAQVYYVGKAIAHNMVRLKILPRIDSTRLPGGGIRKERKISAKKLDQKAIR